MSTITRPTFAFAEGLELNSGDRLAREEFHCLYERAPADFRAELVGGIVYVNSPLKRLHGTSHTSLSMVYALYESRTPGVESGDNATILLGDDAEPQPDLYLRIAPECGGQSRTSDDDYVVGPPEFLTEIASSSRAIDLHAKRADYTRYGVREYLVYSLRERALHWFDLQSPAELAADADGVIRVRVFPGLWIHVAALLERDGKQLIATLNEGLASPEHAAFVARLQACRDSPSTNV